MEKYNSGSCTICTKHFELLHWHHTIPRSLGGENSLQIPLCAQCHNLLHAHGVAIVAARRSGKGVKRKFWKNTTEEINAAPYLEILVKALLKGDDVHGKQYVMSFKATPALHRALSLYKKDSSAQSLEHALIVLISAQLRNMGYLEHETTRHTRSDQRTQQNPSNGSLQKLWGL